MPQVAAGCSRVQQGATVWNRVQQGFSRVPQGAAGCTRVQEGDAVCSSVRQVAPGYRARAEQGVAECSKHTTKHFLKVLGENSSQSDQTEKYFS